MTTNETGKWLVIVDGRPEISVRIDDHAEAFNAATVVAKALAKLYVGDQVRVVDATTLKTRGYYTGERVQTVQVRRKRIPR